MSVANCDSSGCRELIETSTMRFPAKPVQAEWFRTQRAGFGIGCNPAERGMNPLPVVVVLETLEFSLEVARVPEGDLIEGIVTLTMRNDGMAYCIFLQAHVTCSYRSNAPARKVR